MNKKIYICFDYKALTFGSSFNNSIFDWSLYTTLNTLTPTILHSFSTQNEWVLKDNVQDYTRIQHATRILQ